MTSLESTPRPVAAAALPAAFDGLLDRIEGSLEKWAAGRGWWWKLAALCSLCSIFYAAPNFTLLWPKEPPLLWSVVDRQTSNLLTPVTDVDSTTHESKRVFRLTPPALAKLSPVANWKGRMLFLFALQYTAGIVFFALCGRLLNAMLHSPAAATLLTLSFAFIYPGQAFFWDVTGWFDGLAIFLLVLTLVVRSAPLIFACLFAAFWVDERAIVASSFSFLWLKLRERPDATARDLLCPDLRSAMVPLAIGVTLLLRTYLARTHGFLLPISAEAGVGLAPFFKDDRLFRLPLGILSPFKAHWALFVLAGASAWLNRQWALLLLGSAAVAASTLAAVAVADVTRSLAYAFPGVLVAVGTIARHAGARFMVELSAIVLLLAIVLPSYNVMSGVNWMFPLPLKMLQSPLLWR